MIVIMNKAVSLFFLFCLLLGIASAQGIDDHSLQHQITAAAEDLIEKGKTTKMSELVSQLDRSSCQLKLPSAEAITTDAQELYERASKSVLIVSRVYRCDLCGHWHDRSTSGFLITGSGAFATNYHVVDAADNETMVATTFDGQVFPVREVLAANERDDVAILQLDLGGAEPHLTPLSISPHSAAGAKIYVISHPEGHFYTLTEGIVSRLAVVATPNGKASQLFVTADFAKGSSGAPVLNQNAQVVGIATSTHSVYYTRTKRIQKDLQMVFRSCVPSQSLLNLIEIPDP
jgi:S1-C subfamily serine protease